MTSVTAFLEGKLRLKVNQQKSAVAPVGERQFLGHRLGKHGNLGIGRKGLERAKDRLRKATRRNRGITLGRMVEEANRFIVGWVTYYRDARCRSTLLDLDGWLRRKFRCVRLKQCKNPATIASFYGRMAYGSGRHDNWRPQEKAGGGSRIPSRPRRPCQTAGSTRLGWSAWPITMPR